MERLRIRKSTKDRRLLRFYSKSGVSPLFVLFLFLAFKLPCYAQTAPAADLVIINANVRTMRSEGSTAGAIAVAGTRIVAVGDNAAIKKRIGPATEVIDARGRLVLPGFNDAHVHFMGIGNSFSSLNLRDANDPQSIIDRIERYVRVLPKGRWILGGGWNDASWKLPERHSIDAMTSANPVFLYNADASSAFANRLAFQLAGLKDSRPDVDRDVNGEPNGIVRGDAMLRIAAAVPVNQTRNWIEVAETATNYAASLGVTSVQDMHSDDSRGVLRDLERTGKLKTRVYDCVPLQDAKKLLKSNFLRDNTSMVRDGCLKGFSDGDASAAAKLESEIIAADKAGLQVMIHAIGNSANSIVLDAFEHAIKANTRRDRRFRVEHAHNVRVADLPRFSRSQIIASMQPHLFKGGNGEYYRTLLRSKAKVAFGSDAAITDLDPILGIYAAVNAGSESVSVYEAVRAYTVGSAYAEFQEKEKGTIEVGKLADFVILSDDIFSATSGRFRGIRVLMTIVGGRVVYRNGLE
jgi:predicted amidohydrolase YtcJ